MSSLLRDFPGSLLWAFLKVPHAGGRGVVLPEEQEVMCLGLEARSDL